MKNKNSLEHGKIGEKIRKQENNKITNEKNCEGSFISKVLQEIENQILIVIYNKCIISAALARELFYNYIGRFRNMSTFFCLYRGQISR